jgi:hypothetical protein
MTGAIRLATDADVPRIADYLAATLRGDGGAERYRRYLDASWSRDRPDRGVVIDDGGIHGYIGTIYSERMLGGRAHTFCNINSVAVDESHRKLTLQAFNLLLRRKDITFTCFSPSEKIAAILAFFKFQHRPGERVIVPMTTLGLVRRVAGLKMLTDPDEIDAVLDDEGRQIARSHRRYGCAQLVLARDGRTCHVVAARRGRGMRVFAEILYASDRTLLLDELSALHAPLLRMLRTPLVGIDPRWLARPPRISATYSKLRPTYARSPVVPIDEIDFLYSELVAIHAA